MTYLPVHEDGLVRPEELEAATGAEIRVTGQAEGSLTFTAAGTVPEADIRVCVQMA